MKRIKLTEKDLSRIARRVIKEDSNLEDYNNKYSELVENLNYLLDQLDNLANEFEDLSEEVYSQSDSFEEEGEEDYDKEQMKVELEDIAHSSMSYAEIISRCTNKIAGYM